jgi:hypothetical protein
MSAMLDTHSADYLQTVAARTATILRRALLGTYLHGSAVLGGFAPTRSDLDLLTVTTGPLSATTKQQLATALSPQVLPCSAVRGLELSVVTRTTTLAPTPTAPFELHLATSNATTRVVDGQGHPGDPDLLLHFAVCRDHGHPLTGPPPRQLFAPIPRRWLLQGLARELAWAQQHASVEYQVLNACRAWRFTTRTCSAPSSTAASGHAPASMIPPSSNSPSSANRANWFNRQTSPPSPHSCRTSCTGYTRNLSPPMPNHPTIPPLNSRAFTASEYHYSANCMVRGGWRWRSWSHARLVWMATHTVVQPPG